MNRERKVADVYEAVRSITEPEAFQLVIAGEADDYVLADLRNRFWGGTGEKPWQVVEINRLLTRRKEGRAGASVDVRRDSQAVKPPSLKERIENNLVVFFLATLLTGFFAGLGAYQGALTLVDYSPISNDALRVLRDDVEKKGATITTHTPVVPCGHDSVQACRLRTSRCQSILRHTISLSNCSLSHQTVSSGGSRAKKLFP